MPHVLRLARQPTLAARDGHVTDGDGYLTATRRSGRGGGSTRLTNRKLYEAENTRGRRRTSKMTQILRKYAAIRINVTTLNTQLRSCLTRDGIATRFETRKAVNFGGLRRPCHRGRWLFYGNETAWPLRLEHTTHDSKNARGRSYPWQAMHEQHDGNITRYTAIRINVTTSNTKLLRPSTSTPKP